MPHDPSRCRAKSPGQNKIQAGFTLIELLVVVAIIGLLIALLMPTLHSAMDRGRDAQCRSNLRQLGSATLVYAAERNGTLPSCYRWVWSDGAQGKSWSTVVEWSEEDTIPRGVLYTNYLGQANRVFLCPLFRKALQFNPNVAHLVPRVSYVMNEYVGEGRAVARISQEPNPTGLVLYGEESPYYTTNNPRYVINNLALHPGQPNGGPVDALASFHGLRSTDDLASGDCNVFFFDGHLDRARSDQTRELGIPTKVMEAAGNP